MKNKILPSVSFSAILNFDRGGIPKQNFIFKCFFEASD